MDKFQKIKLDSLIHILAVEHKNASGKPLYKTALFKYIDLFEFELIKETGTPPLNLKYNALKNGPVPINLNSQLSRYSYHSDFVRFETEEINDSEAIKFIPTTEEFNFDYFNEYEIEKIYDLIDRFGKNYKDNKKLIDATHEIHSWRKAWDERRTPDKSSEEMHLSDEVEAIDDPVTKEHLVASLL